MVISMLIKKAGRL